MADNQIITIKDQAQANNVLVDAGTTKTIKIEVGSPSNNVPTTSTIVTVETKPSVRISTIGIQGPQGPQGIQGPPGFEPGDELIAKLVELTQEATEPNQAVSKGYVDDAVSAISQTLEENVSTVSEDLAALVSSINSVSQSLETATTSYKQVIILDESYLEFEEAPGVLSIPIDAPETLLNAYTITCYIDGRYMNENSGWYLGTLGLTFEIILPSDLELRARYLNSEVEYTFLWSY